MKTTRYLIVGGGMTGDAAAQGIREHDADGAIVLVGSEPHPPYKRPPLTKGLWSGGDEAKIWRGTADRGVDVVLGRTIVALDLDERRATDDAGDEYAWEKLLLATGGRPRELADADGDVVYFRTLDDYRKLRVIADDGKHVVVVGGGFIGSELAAALLGAGARVTMLLPEAAIAARTLPPELAAFVTGYYREKGVDVLTGETAESVRGGVLTTGTGRTIEGDAVVAGLGIVPNVALAEAAGLQVDNGIVVDELGRVDGRDDVFAAGDVANFPLLALGHSARVEHEDHALTHGKTVGANMAGAAQPYDHIPFFYSDLFDLGYEAVGDVDARLATVERWDEPNRKGVVAYVDDDRRPRGFLLWNTWDKVDAARELIRAGAPIDEGTLV
ncbi:MAG: 3-phenylpropionate/trans-cinnamate dioxygenase ferredoxin reductase component [Gaiellaceae bacterium]|jgi:NADPH-dependent 2,4-dienoyl-CoA reductase/sulfur reductase-like enzyme|nr:3-phenylpropionate/trans-cinnamate dioxygenase ferredoxin reductase component [Gaiellaceae bacterium]